MNEVYIVSAVRTPMGSFNGVFSDIPATKLGATAIKGALEKAGINPNEVNEVFMGNVLQAGEGQAPARQAAIFAGLPYEVACTTVNKVCSSGMKSVMLAAQSIMLGHNECVVAGGMENMSLVPHYLMNSRKGYKFGDVKIIDGVLHDGLKDVYNDYMMGNAAENTAAEMNITREEQDEFAIKSYKKSADAWQNGRFNEEIVGVEVPQRKGDPLLVTEDEEYKNVFFDKIPSLKPAFIKDGTITAANSSTMNDGAAALVLMSKSKMESLGLKPLAKILSFADAGQAPEWFTTAPSKALPIALGRAGCSIDSVDLFEINEAFSVVSLANNRILKLDESKVNVNGGAISLGHPLGASGARILVTLIHALKHKGGKIGAAGICNGGGGANAMVLQV
ncbi:MAG: thiolase family protein [Flavobacteriales bacterium]|nr:thiolase family protein [Flavobacteriales bacterium]